MKTKQSITPGPWRRDSRDNYSVKVDEEYISSFTLRNDDTDVALVLDRNEANAQAIARVPELLAFVGLVARMQTEEEYGENAPESEDWISTLNDLIASARKLVK